MEPTALAIDAAGAASVVRKERQFSLEPSSMSRDSGPPEVEPREAASVIEEEDSGENDEGDLIKNQQKLLDAVKKMISEVQPVKDKVAKVRADAKSQRAAEDASRKAQKEAITKLKDKIASVKQEVAVDHQKGVLEAKGIQKEVFALEANVLENRKLTSDAASQAEIDDQTLLSNQEKLKQDISAVKADILQNREANKQAAARAQTGHKALGDKIQQTKAKLLEETGKITALVAEVERDVEVNRKEAKEHANAASSANKAIESQVDESRKSLGNELVTATNQINEIKTGLDQHRAAVREEQSRIDEGHKAISAKIATTETALGVQIKSMHTAISAVEETIADGRKHTVASSKHSKAAADELASAIGKASEGLETARGSVAKLEQTVQEGQLQDRKANADISAEIDTVRRALSQKAEEVHQTIQQAKTIVEEGRHEQETRQQSGIEGDAEISKLLRKAHEQVQGLALGTQGGRESEYWQEYGSYSEFYYGPPSPTPVR